MGKNNHNIITTTTKLVTGKCKQAVEFGTDMENQKPGDLYPCIQGPYGLHAGVS